MKKALSFVLLLAVTSSGCSKLMGNLRRDLDDSEPTYSEPVIGGRWTERGMLAPEAEMGDVYSAVGHSERSPASAESGDLGQTPWAGDGYARTAGREEGEYFPSSGNTPVVEPPMKRVYKNGSRATRADFIDESQNEGSLWASDGQTNYYFTKNKIRGVGDLVTVNMESDFVRDVAQEVKRSLTPRERDIELAIAQERIRAKVLGLEDPDKKKDAISTAAAAPARQPEAKKESAEEEVEEPKIPNASMADIDLSKALEVKAGDVIMAEIVERYPNGNYKIRGTKKIPYKNGKPRLVSVMAIARSVDIGEDDVVKSGKLYEYRIEAIH